ncbi:hypothetical protein HDU85_003771 [Gaertneriomyces sp. JEL0708]|nr:hypothetical protein HDU85_003771 [Gaertneriomyces sp. JEL0708]
MTVSHDKQLVSSSSFSTATAGPQSATQHLAMCLTEEQHKDCRQRLIDEIPEVPADAIGLMFDAGYETVEMIKTLNVDLSDPWNDIKQAEVYCQKLLKPGHKKLLVQYVQGHSYFPDATEIRNDAGSMLLGSPSPVSTPQSSNPNPNKRRATEDAKDVDYKVAVGLSPDSNIPDGIWKCLVCSSRPVVIMLRNSGRQPQLSNVSTHLKTIKHTTALHQRNEHSVNQYLARAIAQGTEGTNMLQNSVQQGTHSFPASFAAAFGLVSQRDPPVAHLLSGQRQLDQQRHQYGQQPVPSSPSQTLSEQSISVSGVSSAVAPASSVAMESLNVKRTHNVGLSTFPPEFVHGRQMADSSATHLSVSLGGLDAAQLSQRTG